MWEILEDDVTDIKDLIGALHFGALGIRQIHDQGKPDYCCVGEPCLLVTSVLVTHDV